MQDSSLPGTEMLKTVLEPLLEDFNHWFTRSRELLETGQLSFMSHQEQSDLLLRVKQAQEELKAATMLFTATDGQVGIEMNTLMPWHRLVTECWNVSMRLHQTREG
ncbi:DUF2605 domain-containing protein [Nodularia harveyana UHCC-0300]|uniref:DUF2605 domain-containing protein n=1 Tax=Nodularia harveyana UHCC-0300 TaxID=2974287 RepID=A0ABU5UKK4_9CYAN|nr:DUF2605 domain-containing protein [Nodularia harveyana]MEA5582961.1 DUF2605 domain-containing protein [Nodularia harveyana UHCC-0300]